MINQKMCLLCLFDSYLKIPKTAWNSQHSCWIPSGLPAFCGAPRGRAREAIDSDSPPTRLHITLLIGIISDWRSTALATNSGVNRLQHVAWSWLSPSVNNPEGFSVSAYGENWGRHTATKGKEADRPGSSFTLDRLIEALPQRICLHCWSLSFLHGALKNL